MILIAVCLYIGAITVANLIVAAYGTVVMPFLAFSMIGLDLALRNWLQVRLKRWHMGALILATGCLTYLLNPAAQFIAIASAVAFAVAGVVEWLTFTYAKGVWFQRSVLGGIAGAAADSLIFPTLAFGALMPAVVLIQFAAKVVGSAMWSWALSRRVVRT